MKDHAFWQQKLIQLFHDPPNKPFTGYGTVRGHKAVAEQIFDIVQAHNTDREWRHWFKPADWAAAGADRPMLYAPRGDAGGERVFWHKAPVITHPLSRRFWLELRGDAGVPPDEDAGDLDPAAAVALNDEVKALAGEMAERLKDWSNPEDLKRAFVAYWRRYRDDLIHGRNFDALWQEMPADSRSPDHSIWDHLKVATALAFLKPHKMKEAIGDEGSREPWMLRMGLGPVGPFLKQARTARDLWTASFLLSDLVWHMMQPVVERYGPDCIVYPDLHGNPRADAWLKDAFPGAIDPKVDVPSSYASMIPDNFVALVPRGDEGMLKDLPDLCAEASKAVERRWHALTDTVRDWLSAEVAGDGGWTGIWVRQTATCPLRASWVAVPWKPLGQIKDTASLKGPALPCQPPPTDIDPEDAAAIGGRCGRLAPWVPQKAWAAYEEARSVYAKSRLDYHQMERGFDYAVTHHQLMVRHAARRSMAAAHPATPEEPGEKCTLCGEREALHDGDAGGPMSAMRQAARTFWSKEKLDPDRTGAERLCAVCTTRRFLVTADRGGAEFNRLWGYAPSDARKDVPRVPFPSTATVAAQAFLAAVADATDPAVVRARDAVVLAADGVLDRTSHPRALRRLHAAAGTAGEQFLHYEAEDVTFPEVLDGKIETLSARAKEGRGSLDARNRVEKLTALKGAVTDLRKAAAKTEAEAAERAPRTSIAVIRMDADHMGRLLLGDSEKIAATWQDVLHPTTMERLDASQHLKNAGWPGLLNRKRLMGPSLHAFVSRALGHFAHRILPWVVECEFGGSLIFAGGDELLCIAPTEEAIDLIARLQQLFSAPWVVDTAPETPAWGWRRSSRNAAIDQWKARLRFAIPVMPADGPIQLNDPDQPVEPHAADPTGTGTRALAGLLLPMLGHSGSLSAGAAIGHYKTPLSMLLARADGLLEDAKRGGGDAMGIGHASRGGEKTRVVIRRRLDEDWTGRDLLQAVIRGFASGGGLSGRLPYKLREVAPSVAAVITDSAVKDFDRLCDGLFRQALAGEGAAKDTTKAANRLWRLGIDAAPKQPDGWTDGLLLCRMLASGNAQGEDER